MSEPFFIPSVKYRINIDRLNLDIKMINRLVGPFSDQFTSLLFIGQTFLKSY